MQRKAVIVVLVPVHLRRALTIALVLAAGFVLLVLAGAALIDVMGVEEPDLRTEWTAISVAVGIIAGCLASRWSRVRRVLDNRALACTTSHSGKNNG